MKLKILQNFEIAEELWSKLFKTSDLGDTKYFSQLSMYSLKAGAVSYIQFAFNSHNCQ